MAKKRKIQKKQCGEMTTDERKTLSEALGSVDSVLSCQQITKKIKKHPEVIHEQCNTVEHDWTQINKLAKKAGLDTRPFEIEGGEKLMCTILLSELDKLNSMPVETNKEQASLQQKIVEMISELFNKIAAVRVLLRRYALAERMAYVAIAFFNLIKLSVCTAMGYTQATPFGVGGLFLGQLVEVTVIRASRLTTANLINEATQYLTSVLLSGDSFLIRLLRSVVDMSHIIASIINFSGVYNIIYLIFSGCPAWAGQIANYLIKTALINSMYDFNLYKFMILKSVPGTDKDSAQKYTDAIGKELSYLTK
jgi:hypothetical protein